MHQIILRLYSALSTEWPTFRGYHLIRANSEDGFTGRTLTWYGGRFDFTNKIAYFEGVLCVHCGQFQIVAPLNGGCQLCFLHHTHVRSCENVRQKPPLAQRQIQNNFYFIEKKLYIFTEMAT